MSRQRGLVGQATVESILTFPIAIIFAIGIFCGSLALFERVLVTESLSALGSDLPNEEYDVDSGDPIYNWSYYASETATQDERNQFVKSLLVDSDYSWGDGAFSDWSLAKLMLDEDKITVTGATITTSYSKTLTDGLDAEVAAALNATAARAETTIVTISANVTYEFSTLAALFGSSSTTLGVKRSYVVSQIYEYYGS